MPAILFTSLVSCYCWLGAIVSKVNDMSVFFPADDDPTKGPSVEAALSISPTQALSKPTARKPTIGQRKPQSAKKGVSYQVFLIVLPGRAEFLLKG